MFVYVPSVTFVAVKLKNTFLLRKKIRKYNVALFSIELNREFKDSKKKKKSFYPTRWGEEASSGTTATKG